MMSTSPRDEQANESQPRSRTACAKAAEQWMLAPACLHMRAAVLTASP